MPNDTAPTANAACSRADAFSTFDVVALTLVATAFALVSATLASAVSFGNPSLRDLLRSDDHYICGFAVAVPVACCFSLASWVGCRLRSRGIALRLSATLCITLSFSAVAFDAIFDFGEGDQVVHALGVGILIGGLSGLLAFCIRRRSSLMMAAITPFCVYAVLFVYATFC